MKSKYGISKDHSFEELVTIARKYRKDLQQQLFHLIESDDDWLARMERRFSCTPPYVVALEGDPLLHVVSHEDITLIGNRFELDIDVVDKERLGQFSKEEEGGLFLFRGSMLFGVEGHDIDELGYVHLIPVEEDCEIPQENIALPPTASKAWSALERSWKSRGTERPVEDKMELARLVEQALWRIYEEVMRNDAKFAGIVRYELIDHLEEVYYDEIVGTLDALHFFDCAERSASKEQRDAAWLVSKIFNRRNSKYVVLTHELDSFPLLVTKGGRGLFWVFRNGKVLFPRRGLETLRFHPEDWFDSLWVEMNFPDPVGALTFTDFSSAKSLIAGDCRLDSENGSPILAHCILTNAQYRDQVRLHDGVLDIEAFLELSLGAKRAESLLWFHVLKVDESDIDELWKNRDRIEDIDERAWVPENGDITPLMQAAATHSTRFVRTLVKMGADIDATDEAGFSPLTYAIQEKNVENARLLLRMGADPNPVPSGEGRYSPLAMAAEKDLLPLVTTLIDKGADVDWQSHNGTTAVKYAAAAGSARSLRKLIRSGADPVSYDHEGYAAIHNAADRGYVEILRILLSAGVDANIPILPGQMDSGMTPLYRACAGGHLDAVRLLLKKGADLCPNIGDERNCLIATVIDSDEFDDDREEILSLLVKKGILQCLSETSLALTIAVVLLKTPSHVANSLIEKVISLQKRKSVDIDEEAVWNLVESIGMCEHKEECIRKMNELLSRLGFENP